MAKYYIRYNDLLDQATTLANAAKSLDMLHHNLLSVINGMDGRDSSMASLKTQLMSCTRRISLLVDDVNLFQNAVYNVKNDYLKAEKSSYSAFESIKTNSYAADYMSNTNASVKAAGYSADYLAIFSTISAAFIKSGKAIGGIDDLLELLGSNSVLVTAMKKTGIYQAITYTDDAMKLAGALAAGNSKELWRLIEKYTEKGGKGILKNTFGISGFSASAYVNLAWNFGENILDLDKYAYVGTSTSMPVGFAQYLWHISGNALIETGVEIGYDILHDVGGFVGYDLDKTYEDLVGTGGVEGFYKATGQLGQELFGDYYKDNSVGGILKGTGDIAGKVAGFWGSAITGWFK